MSNVKFLVDVVDESGKVLIAANSVMSSKNIPKTLDLPGLFVEDSVIETDEKPQKVVEVVLEPKKKAVKK